MTIHANAPADGPSRHPVLASDEIATIAAALRAGQALDPSPGVSGGPATAIGMDLE